MTPRHSLVASLFLAVACREPGTAGTEPGTSQVPPTTSSADVDAWLDGAFYTQWHCEPAAHPARYPSPHRVNRICSNDALSSAGAGEYPVDAAAVKEIVDGDKVIGHALYRHVRPGTTGDTWFWYERDGDTVFAVGLGDKGTPHDSCVACHEAAGSDSRHSGHDFVYTQVH